LLNSYFIFLVSFSKIRETVLFLLPPKFGGFFFFYQLFLKYPLDLLPILLFRLKIIVVFKISGKNDEKMSENRETLGQTRNVLLVLLLLP